jgi:amino-acid N-acetyltransferase
LVSDAEAWATERGIKTLYLLTTTAAQFFSRLGYEAIPRSEAAAAIAATAQFSDLCPASSTLMRKVLAVRN